jgi:hypothetical protein
MPEQQDPTEPTPRPARESAGAPGTGVPPQSAPPSAPQSFPQSPPQATPQSPPQAAPQGAPQAAPQGAPRSAPASAYPAGPPPRRPGLWRQATSTTGGTIAVAVAAAALALLLLGMVGLGGLFVARAVASNHRDDRQEQVRDRGVFGNRDDRLPPGRQGQGNGNGGQPRQLPPQRDGAAPGAGGGGLAELLRGAQALGAVQHGEFTVNGTDGKATVMTVQRGTVTAVSATSLSVKSADGFTATYKLDDATRGGGGLAKDDAAVVIARKAGAAAVVVREVRTR